MRVQSYGLSKGNKFFSVTEDFTSPALYHPSTMRFASEEAALDKAVALGVHLDRVNTHKIYTRED